MADPHRSAPPGLIRIIDRIQGSLCAMETAVVAISLATLVGVGVYQSIASHLLGTNDTWPYEVIRYAVFVTAMAGAALAAGRRSLLNMDVITRLVSPTKRLVLGVATNVVALLACLLLVQGGFDVSNTAAAAAAAYDIIPAPLGILALPVGGLLIALHLLLHIAFDVTYLARGEVPPEPSPEVA